MRRDVPVAGERDDVGAPGRDGRLAPVLAEDLDQEAFALRLRAPRGRVP